MFFRIFLRLCGQVGCYLIKKGGFTLYKKQLTKAEFELANNALESILDEPVEDIDLTDTLPPKTDLTDSNKVFKGKLSILFVDMRKSTDLTDELKSKKMVKVYRAFIRIIIQAIRYSGGYTRQFAGRWNYGSIPR
jgi:adenylate cyclase